MPFFIKKLLRIQGKIREISKTSEEDQGAFLEYQGKISENSKKEVKNTKKANLGDRFLKYQGKIRGLSLNIREKSGKIVKKKEKMQRKPI